MKPVFIKKPPFSRISYIGIIFFAFVFLLTSCTKTTNRGIEIEYRTDTVFTAKDTTFIMDTAYWNAFSFTTGGLVAPGPSTFFNTAEGIKFKSPGFRSGIRLQTKNEVGFQNKNIYYKWKANGAGQPSFIGPALKYQPLTSDLGAISQGLYFSEFFTDATSPGFAVDDEKWYYTRIQPVIGTDTFNVITSTGNYNNFSGTVLFNKAVAVYTKTGYISLVFGDNRTDQAFVVLGECKISAK